MKQNTLVTFLNKIDSLPVWLKQIIYFELKKDVGSVEKTLDILTLYKPILTYQGRMELEKHLSSLDSNTYNFLEYVKNDCSLAEFALNTYLTMEEVAKYFLFSLEQKFIEQPKNNEIDMFLGLIAGKYDIGEYFVKKGTLTEDQLKQIVCECENNNQNEFDYSRYIPQKQIDKMLKIKKDFLKRIVLDSEIIPEYEDVCISKEEKYKLEIQDLKSENQMLKKKILQLSKLVK